MMVAAAAAPELGRPVDSTRRRRGGRGQQLEGSGANGGSGGEPATTSQPQSQQQQQQPRGTKQQQQQQQQQPRPPDGLRPEQLPRHVAIIMDGNSRYASARGWPASAGHAAGVAALRDTVKAAARFGVRALTVYAFSEENWARGRAEVDFLMGLFSRALRDELPALLDASVRLRFVGGLARLPPALREEAARAEAATSGGGGLLLTVALSYSAQADIAAAARALAEDAAAGRLDPADVTPALLASRLSTAATLREAGPPDLCIRTSGEQRLSNFLLFEMAYAELVFESALWPEFGAAHLEAALRRYAASERRYGGRRGGGGGGGDGSGGGSGSGEGLLGSSKSSISSSSSSGGGSRDGPS